MSNTEKNARLEELETDLLLEAVNRYYGYDFRDYDPGVVRRRIRECMLAGRVSTISRFQDRLLRQPALLERFLSSFSSAALSMFSDAGFYRALRMKVVPHLRTYPFIRIWHVGCSTGEEAYALAILLNEEGLYQRSRIYATDLSEGAIRQARLGSFGSSLADQYSANYQKAGGSRSLPDYFNKKGSRMLVESSVQKNIVFSQHNLATDGSFNEFQVIICRGILGSFNHKLRARVDRLIYDSLARFGVLALGPAESLDGMPYEDHYALLDEESRLYQKQRSYVISRLEALERKKG